MLVYAQSFDGVTLFEELALKNKWPVLLELIDMIPGEQKLLDWLFNELLILAIDQDQPKVIKALIKLGADPFYCQWLDSKNSFTSAIAHAASKKRWDCVREFTAVDPKLERNTQGYASACFDAAIAGESQLALLLLRFTDMAQLCVLPQGQDFLHIARSTKDLALLEAVIAMGFRPDTRLEGVTVVEKSAQDGDWEATTVMVNAGAIDAATAGRVLLLAAQADQREITAILLNRHNPSAHCCYSDEGFYASHYLCKHDDADNLRQLLAICPALINRDYASLDRADARKLKHVTEGLVSFAYSRKSYNCVLLLLPLQSDITDNDKYRELLWRAARDGQFQIVG